MRQFGYYWVQFSSHKVEIAFWQAPINTDDSNKAAGYWHRVGSKYSYENPSWVGSKIEMPINAPIQNIFDDPESHKQALLLQSQQEAQSK
jgi:hypothetical protein